MKLYKFKFMCDDCKEILEVWTNAITNPDKQDWYKGFICGNCEMKRTNIDYWSKFSE